MRLKSPELRGAIIKGAIECYKIDGVQNASMDMIAKKAGTTKATVYAHFGSKDQLFEAVFDVIRSHNNELAIAPYAGKHSMVGQLVDFYIAFLDHALDENSLDLYRAIVVETTRRSAEVPMNVTPGEEDDLIKWLCDAMDDDALNVDNATVVAKNLMGTVRGRFFWTVLLGIKKISKSERDRQVREAIEYFMRPLIP